MVQLSLPSLPPDSTRDPAIFFTWAVLCVVAFGSSSWIARGHKDVSGFVLLPLIAVFMFFDNMTLAVDALNGTLVNAYPAHLRVEPDAVDASEGATIVGLQRVRAAVQAFLIPLLLVTGARKRPARVSARLCGCWLWARHAHSLLSRPAPTPQSLS